jgi:benzaldehyde dehydrogenase (NAD)
MKPTGIITALRTGAYLHHLQLLSEEPVPGSPSFTAGAIGYLQRGIVRVIGGITSWNFPLLLAMRSVAPALVLGKRVVFKPDLQTPSSRPRSGYWTDQSN